MTQQRLLGKAVTLDIGFVKFSMAAMHGDTSLSLNHFMRFPDVFKGHRKIPEPRNGLKSFILELLIACFVTDISN